MPKVIIDLDDTLINTSDLKEEMIEIIGAMGVPRDVIIEKYQDSKNESGIPIIDSLVTSLAEYGVDTESLKGQLESMYSCIGEERLLLERLANLEPRYPREEYKYVLVTRGEEDVQHRKISAFNLQSVFDEVRVVSGLKAEYIGDLVEPGEPFVFVDDKKSEREAILEKWPEVEVIDPVTLDEEIRQEQQEQPSMREGGI